MDRHWYAAVLGLMATALPALAEAPATATSPTPAAPAAVSALPAAAPTARPATAALHGETSCGSTASCESCCPEACSCCNPPCGPPGRAWLEAEWLFWYIHGNPIPPLVTAGIPTTPRPAAGVLGQPFTTVLVGDERVSGGDRPGFRVRGGFWFDCCHTCGVEASYFDTPHHSDTVTFGAPSLPLVARPFINATTGLPDAEFVVFPGVVTGTVTVSNTPSLTGGDINMRKNLCCSCCGRVDLLAGYRPQRFTEETVITENLINLSTNRGIPVGTSIVVQDSIRTQNTFNGGQIGLAGEYRSGCFYFDARALFAAGDLSRVVDINGQTIVTVPGGTPVVRVGGLLAQPSNIGHYTSHTFALAPEIGLKVGYQVLEHVRVSAGYTFLYMTDVARSGDQISRVANPVQLVPGTVAPATSPTFTLQDANLFVQGISLGVEVRY